VGDFAETLVVLYDEYSLKRHIWREDYTLPQSTWLSTGA
jgi:hypothetical protein